MKRVILCLSLLLAAAAALWLLKGQAAPAVVGSVSPSVSPSPWPEKTAQPAETSSAEEPLTGVWVPYLSLDAGGKGEKAFRENFQAIADAAKKRGLNALFVHVRPFCDALYPSKLYPWSHILTGQQGKDPGYDPLAFMVEYTHKLGLQFHAWINPLRVSTAETPAALSDDSPYLTLKDDYPYYFMEWGGGVYLNPAWPYVRTLIADGAKEIVEHYDVDGIHFDDYFYPSQEEDLDWQAYELYTGQTQAPLGLLEWRQTNISAMVQEVYQAVKAADPQVSFGISPQGNIENDENMGADVSSWCAVSGYLDYICPQLYYSFDNPALGFDEALDQWVALPKRKGLKLYIGLALYKAGTDADQGTWQTSQDNIRRQVEESYAKACNGIILYSSDYLDAEQTKAEMANAFPIKPE